MRDAAVIFSTCIIFIGLLYGGRLQDRMRQKAHRAGDSMFSVAAVFRAFATREMLYSIILLSVMFLFAGVMLLLDRSGYFSDG
jgi:hypothetical protein